MEIDRFYTSKEVAQILRRAESTIRRRCDFDEFEGAFKDGKCWLIPVATLENMLKRASVTKEMVYK